MTPEMLAVVRSGAGLTRAQYRSYIDHEAKAAGITGGVREAIRRADSDVKPMNSGEERLRFIMTPYLESRPRAYTGWRMVPTHRLTVSQSDLNSRIPILQQTHTTPTDQGVCNPSSPSPMPDHHMW